MDSSSCFAVNFVLVCPPAHWTVARRELLERTTTFEDGSEGVWRDGVLRLDRR